MGISTYMQASVPSLFTDGQAGDDFEYGDPYADYTNYYSDDDYYDISAWDYLPYEYYAWCQLDYTTWTDPSLFEPDWDY